MARKKGIVVASGASSYTVHPGEKEYEQALKRREKKRAVEAPTVPESVGMPPQKKQKRSPQKRHSVAPVSGNQSTAGKSDGHPITRTQRTGKTRSRVLDGTSDNVDGHNSTNKDTAEAQQSSNGSRNSNRRQESYRRPTPPAKPVLQPTTMQRVELPWTLADAQCIVKLSLPSHMVSRYKTYVEIDEKCRSTLVRLADYGEGTSAVAMPEKGRAAQVSRSELIAASCWAVETVVNADGQPVLSNNDLRGLPDKRLYVTIPRDCFGHLLERSKKTEYAAWAQKYQGIIRSANGNVGGANEQNPREADPALRHDFKVGQTPMPQLLKLRLWNLASEEFEDMEWSKRNKEQVADWMWSNQDKISLFTRWINQVRLRVELGSDIPARSPYHGSESALLYSLRSQGLTLKQIVTKFNALRHPASEFRSIYGITAEIKRLDEADVRDKKGNESKMNAYLSFHLLREFNTWQRVVEEVGGAFVRPSDIVADSAVPRIVWSLTDEVGRRMKIVL